MIGGNALRKIKSKIPFKLEIPELTDVLTIPETLPFIIAITPESVMAVHVNCHDGFYMK